VRRHGSSAAQPQTGPRCDVTVIGHAERIAHLLMRRMCSALSKRNKGVGQENWHPCLYPYSTNSPECDCTVFKSNRCFLYRSHLTGKNILLGSQIVYNAVQRRRDAADHGTNALLKLQMVEQSTGIRLCVPKNYLLLSLSSSRGQRNRFESFAGIGHVPLHRCLSNAADDIELLPIDIVWQTIWWSRVTGTCVTVEPPLLSIGVHFASVNGQEAVEVSVESSFIVRVMILS
ncbi:unnamed protein product, partial [Larinioides sclopetarius]